MDFTDVDSATILSGRSDWMNADHASRLARHPLDSLDTEFPHYVGSVDGPDALERPREQHPIFFGCFDWHSAVHSHWALVRQLRLFDDHPEETAIVETFDARLTPENVADEVAYFEDNPTFERPYGWGWFLRLAAELELWDDDRVRGWRAVLAPLEARIVDLVETEFLTQDRPFRVGTHANSAFALQCVLDYARVTGDDSLEAATADTARRFFERDRDYPVEYEPLGWDFLSPALEEADLMRRVLDHGEFQRWLDGFLPDVTSAPYDSILEPVDVDGENGMALHLVGLNLSKAACLAGIRDALPDHRFAEPFQRSADRHARAGLVQAFTDDYAGSHWLSSFALYLLTRNEGGTAPNIL